MVIDFIECLRKVYDNDICLFTALYHVNDVVYKPNHGFTGSLITEAHMCVVEYAVFLSIISVSAPGFSAFAFAYPRQMFFLSLRWIN